ncbi:MBL fold metallo-hydrolase [Paenibacillus sp. FSL R7-0652]|uniref:MBL fold metallo-hydrolase n=1 Tax=Paenibacillus sp. FSL R7-0652 TaxID=2921687 RepID=UPI00315A049F
MIKLNVWGGAGEHGRSAYLLRGSRQRLLLDCGVKKEGSGEYPLIEPEVVPQLDAVLLSHAHEDHSAAIPLLYRLGYTGEVWTTRETKEQLTTYFKAWRRNMEHAGQPLPYGEADEQLIRYRFLEDEAERECWFELLPGVSVIWGRSGHLAGSVWLGIEMEGKRILYSGDYTSESILLQADDIAEGLQQADLRRRRQIEPMLAASVTGGLPRLSLSDKCKDKSKNPLVKVDLAIIDAAYGTDRDTQADKLQQLESAVCETISRGGKILLPMPAVGRGQELILWAQQRFSNVPMIVEQKLVEGMKQLHLSHSWLRESREQFTRCSPAGRIAAFLSGESWERAGSAEKRKELLEKHGASLWFIPDGMMQSSLARWYYEVWASDANNLVLLTGHTAAGTLAHQLLESPEQYGVCGVKKVRYKVHQGWRDVEYMINRVSARHNVLVHTNLAETERLRVGLLGGQFRSGTSIDLLSPGDELIF